jgi:hypothetical protein
MDCLAPYSIDNTNALVTAIPMVPDRMVVDLIGVKVRLWLRDRLKKWEKGDCPFDNEGDE